jgi:hypothetical protein
MTALRTVTGILLISILSVACHTNSGTATACDCTVFPPKQGCDTSCGIATGVVESVSGDSVTIKVPVIETPANGTPVEAPATTTIQRRTFTLSPAEQTLVANIKPGSHVAFTYAQEADHQVLKSIQTVQPALKSGATQ